MDFREADLAEKSKNDGLSAGTKESLLEDLHSEKMKARSTEAAGLKQAQIQDDYSSAPEDKNKQPPQFFISAKSEVGKCDAHDAITKDKDVLESAAKGESVLHRLVELSILTPQGRLTPSDFPSVYGSSIASRLNGLGVLEIDRNGLFTSARLLNPLKIDDPNGSIDISTSISFLASRQSGTLNLEKIRGVAVSSGFISLPVNSMELLPRKEGYISGNVSASWLKAPLCALPDGRVAH